MSNMFEPSRRTLTPEKFAIMVNGIGLTNLESSIMQEECDIRLEEGERINLTHDAKREIAVGAWKKVKAGNPAFFQHHTR